MPESAESRQNTTVSVATTELRAGAIGFPAVLAQSVALISPGFAFLLAGSFIATQVGYAMPITYIGGAILCMAIALTLFQLAREWPSAGGYFTYVSRALHPRLGMLTGWVFIVYAPLVWPVCATIVGFLIQTEMQASLGWSLPWWVSAAVFVGVTALLGLRGIKVSGVVLVALTFTELAILLAFAITGLVHPGPGGFTLKPFTLDPKFGISGVALGVVYVIFAFAGFESAAPLAEESRWPSKYVPWAIVGSIALMTVFFVIAWLGMVNGVGIANFDGKFAGQPVGAFFTVAQRLWGPVWFIILIALINSVFGICMSSVLYVSRMFYSFGRAGLLPAWVGRLHHRIPRNAIIFATGLAVAWGLAIALWIGPDNAYFWTGLLITWSLVIIFATGAVGVFWHWFHVRGERFNWFWHFVVPLVAVGGCGVTWYYSLPSLTGAYFWTLPLVLIWIALGIGLLFFFHATGREQWLLKATEYAFEHQMTEEELRASDAELSRDA